MFSLTINKRTYRADELAGGVASAESHPAVAFCRTWLSGQTAFALHTSGSTGKPRPITVSREQMRASAHFTGAALGLQVGDRALVCLSTDYIAGVMMLVRGMELDLAVTVVPPRRNPLAAFSAETRFDFTAVVPMQMQAILNSPQRIIADHMQAIIIGGAAVTPSLEHDLQSLNAAVYNSYGMTETVSHIALRRLNGPHPDAYFVPFAAVKLGLDEQQCLTITSILSGGKTIVTNDRVELLSDGRFRWLGRIDNVINSGGYKVQAERVEAALHTVLGENRRLVVGGMPDATFGEQVVAIIEGEDSAEIDLHTALLQSGQLHRYELPRQIIFLPHFPETRSGKVDRRATLVIAADKITVQP
ncbi:MAG: AMP-binding protein [Anaerolineae bacterium]|nr:AMP-binding protein [Anaerolineae bacterium]